MNWYADRSTGAQKELALLAPSPEAGHLLYCRGEGRLLHGRPGLRKNERQRSEPDSIAVFSLMDFFSMNPPQAAV